MPKFKKTLKDPFFILALLGIGGFMLQTYVRPYGHYLILMAPFCIFMVIYTYCNIYDERKKLIFKSACGFMTIVFIFKLSVAAIGYCSDTLREQCEYSAKQLEQYIPRGAKNVAHLTDIERLVSYYLETTPYIDDKKAVGLNFEPKEEAILLTLKHSDFLICYGREYGQYITPEMQKIIDLRYNHDEIILENGEKVYVYGKKRE